MWSPAQITVAITVAEHPAVIVEIGTPVGSVEILGMISQSGRVLYISEAHIQGLSSGALGRSGLNAIGRKLLVEADVDQIVVQGSTRTTGRNKGRPPKAFRFPVPSDVES